MIARRRVTVAVCAACLAVPASAGADREQSEARVSAPAPPLDAAYLYDGGMIPFAFLPLALDLSIQALARPPDTPRLFDPGEGGKPSRKDEEIPALWVGAGAALLAVGVAAIPSEARFYHFKGMAQGLATTQLATTAAKYTFGRHRPDYVLGGDNPVDARRSFFSGHASTTWAATTYFGLYLRRHGFAAGRGDRDLPWWEALTYTGLAGVGVVVSAERVVHNRHHLSDVLAGAAVGALTSGLMFWWQESRYQDRRRGGWLW